MNFTTEKVSSSYTIEVTIEQMQRILVRDDAELTVDDCLFSQLALIDGVDDNVEYDGHFGPFIYVTIKDEEDEPDTWKKILQTINEYLGAS